MSFDFGSTDPINSSTDPTSDFVSKFPDLEADDSDAALAAAGNNTNTNVNTNDNGFSSTGWTDEDNDLLSSSATTTQEPRDQREQFESTFPELLDDTADEALPPIQAQKTAYAPSNNNTTTSTNGFNAPLPPTSSTTNTYNNNNNNNISQFDQEEEEPESVREWRHKQGDVIARRDAEGERKKAEAVSQAERDIDDFYREYTAKKEKNIKRNKELEAQFTEKRNKELAEGTTWDRITKLVELQNSQSKTIAPGGAGSTDLSRFKELLLSLRREGETAPAAGGY